MISKPYGAMLAGIVAGGAWLTVVSGTAVGQQLAPKEKAPVVTLPKPDLTPTQAALAALATDTDASLEAWLVRTPHSISVMAKPAVASEITILNVGPSGKIHVLYPNAKLKGSTTAAHQVVQVPEPDATYAVIETKATRGQAELVLVIRSDNPLLIQGRPLLDDANTASAHRLFPTVRLSAPAFASALFEARRSAPSMAILSLVTSQPQSDTRPEAGRGAAAKLLYDQGMDLAFANDGPKGGPKTTLQVTAAIAKFEAASKAGHVPADVRLGVMHERGLGVPADEKAAQRWYERAVAKQNTEAMVRLAQLLAARESKTDQTRALTLLEQAAAKGEPMALRELASVYNGGTGVPANPAKAADLVLKALAVQEWAILEDVATFPAPTLRALQAKLKAAGQFSGAADGIYSAELAAALGTRVTAIRKASR